MTLRTLTRGGAGDGTPVYGGVGENVDGGANAFFVAGLLASETSMRSYVPYKFCNDAGTYPTPLVDGAVACAGVVGVLVLE